MGPLPPPPHHLGGGKDKQPDERADSHTHGQIGQQQVKRNAKQTHRQRERVRATERESESDKRRGGTHRQAGDLPTGRQIDRWVGGTGPPGPLVVVAVLHRGHGGGVQDEGHPPRGALGRWGRRDPTG